MKRLNITYDGFLRLIVHKTMYSYIIHIMHFIYVNPK